MATVLILWFSGFVLSVFLHYRDRRFTVQLPGHAPEEFACTVATAYARISLSILWPVLLVLEALIHRRLTKQ